MTTLIVKRYSNRRLYDTERSLYITLDELAELVRAGREVRVVDARSLEDLTQHTLATIIIEGRNVGNLLPVPLLLQLIRLGDDVLAEFFGRYVSTALEAYLQLRRTGLPFGLPLAGMESLGRLYGMVPWSGFPWGGAPNVAPMPGPLPTQPSSPTDSDVASLRREVQELRSLLRDLRRPDPADDEEENSDAP